MIHPDDDNGDVLRRMEAHGDDLSKSRDIDFIVVFSSEASAREFSKHVEALGCATSAKLSQVVDELPWDVCVVKHMVPSHQAITDFEGLLESIAQAFGGRNDGWGCLFQPILN